MLYFQIIQNGRKRETSWHVGNSSPNIFDNEYEEDEIVIVDCYADGHELEHIVKNFVNLPRQENKTSCVWRGVFAEFLWDNL